jgi:hypothetical protein
VYAGGMVGASLDRLRARILAGLGLALAGCGVGSPALDDEAGVTTDPSGDGNITDDGSGTGTSTGTTGPGTTESGTTEDSSSSESGTSESSSTDESSTSEDADDFPPEPDLPPLGDCTVMQADASVLEQHPDCPIMPDDPESCGSSIYLGCIEAEPGQTCERLCPEGDCIGNWANCQGDPFFDIPHNVCGPYEIDGKCCSIAQYYHICSDGRPFVIDDRSRLAALSTIEGVHEGDRFGRLPIELRRRLAGRWAAIAQAEHASIASFARFTAQLLAVGAPPDLIRDALAAARDEVRHAEVALALASAFEAASLGLGRLDVHEAIGEPVELEAMVLACVREGCIGESMSALELSVAAEACEDSELASRLTEIAEDETRHAELAWRFVRWAIDRRPDLRTKVAESFATLAIDVSEPESITPAERELLRSLGCLPADERHQIEVAGVRSLLRPCAAALLAA